MKVHVAFPGETLPEAYFETRYAVLRKPLGAPKGSERIDGDRTAIHAWIEDDGMIVSVGRAALIPIGEDGSVTDLNADSSCPPFQPLSNGYETIKDDNGIEIPHDLRPAFQIRQMGTLETHRGKGLASEVLKTLENNCEKIWNVRTGWLQARTEALKFYGNNGWICFGAAYSVPNVGAHRNMWKKF